MDETNAYVTMIDLWQEIYGTIQRNKLRTAKLQQRYYTLELEQVKKARYKKIQLAGYNTVASESKYRSSHSAMLANLASFELMNEKYTQGKAAAVEYNEAKLNLLKAQSDAFQTRYDYLFRYKILDFYQGTPID